MLRARYEKEYSISLDFYVDWNNIKFYFLVQHYDQIKKKYNQYEYENFADAVGKFEEIEKSYEVAA